MKQRFTANVWQEGEWFVAQFLKGEITWDLLFTGILTLFTIIYAIVSIFQWKSLKKSVQLGRDQLTLAYPPRVKVTSIHIWQEGDAERNPPPLVPNTKIIGRAYAINWGREDANIERSELLVRWWNELPMKKPHTAGGTTGINPLKRTIGEDFFEEYRTLNSGQIGGWQYDTIVPPDYPHLQLYVLGQVIYRDRLGTRRAIFFCRRYDPDKHRFFPVDNPDYEDEE